MEKFTGEATGSLFPVMTRWDVTGLNVICNIIEETKALWVDFSTIQEDPVIPEMIKRNSGIRLGDLSHMLPQAAQQLESNLSSLRFLLDKLRGVGWVPPSVTGFLGNLMSSCFPFPKWQVKALN